MHPANVAVSPDYGAALCEVSSDMGVFPLDLFGLLGICSGPAIAIREPGWQLQRYLVVVPDCCHDSGMYEAASCMEGALEYGQSEVVPSSLSRRQGRSSRRMLQIKQFLLRAMSPMTSPAVSLNPSRTTPSLQPDVKSGSCPQAADVSTNVTTLGPPQSVNDDCLSLNPSLLCLAIHQGTLGMEHSPITEVSSNVDVLNTTNLTAPLEDEDQEDFKIGDACLQFMDILKPASRTEERPEFMDLLEPAWITEARSEFKDLLKLAWIAEERPENLLVPHFCTSEPVGATFHLL
eukprot:gene4466-14623_t